MRHVREILRRAYAFGIKHLPIFSLKDHSPAASVLVQQGFFRYKGQV